MNGSYTSTDNELQTVRSTPRKLREPCRVLELEMTRRQSNFCIQTRWAKTHLLERIDHPLLAFRPNGESVKYGSSRLSVLLLLYISVLYSDHEPPLYTGPCCLNSAARSIGQNIQESRVVARKPRDATAVLFGLKFANNIHCEFMSFENQASQLQTYGHKKHNLTQNGHSRSFKVTCFAVSGKAIRE